MDYDPKDLDESGGDGWKPEPGEYVFKVDTIVPKTFKTGSQGFCATLLVDAGGKYDSKCFLNIITKTPEPDPGQKKKKNTLWKWKQALEAIGVPFDPAPEDWQVEGQYGKAHFVTEKSQCGKYTNLVPVEFIPASKTAERHTVPAPVGEMDDVPF